MRIDIHQVEIIAWLMPWVEWGMISLIVVLLISTAWKNKYNILEAFK